MEFKDRIRELRTSADLSTTKLANAFGKSEAAVRAWETGRTKPDADTLIRIAKHFSCPVDYLLGLTDVTNPENHAVQKQLNISEEAIEVLSGLSRFINKREGWSLSDVLSEIIVHPEFLGLLKLVNSFMIGGEITEATKRWVDGLEESDGIGAEMHPDIILKMKEVSIINTFIGICQDLKENPPQKYHFIANLEEVANLEGRKERP